MTRVTVLLALGVVLAACAPTSAPGSASSPAPDPTPVSAPSGAPAPPTFALNQAPATLGCDAIGLDYTSLTWRIDPATADPVTAVTNTGATLRTLWAPGFTAGAPGELTVLGPDGAVVVADGDQLKVGERPKGSFVCLGPEKAYVLAQSPQ